MNTTTQFGDRLAVAVRAAKSPVCVGLDPRWPQLPSSITANVHPRDAVAVAAATLKYCQEVIDAVVAFAPVIKPQSAFFEQLGPAGMQTLADVIAYATKAGLIVLLDGKRGDIGSTAEGYADAYLGAESAWKCDAMTVNPYLGADTLVPFVDTASERGAGLFVLVKTSNPGSGFLQDQAIGGSTVYEHVAEAVQNFAQQSAGESGFGHVGAVVGATYPEQLVSLRAKMPNVWFLIPGFGAQGGTASDVRHGFRANGLGAIVNSSRGIIFAYNNAPFSHLPWQDAVAEAARDMKLQLDGIARDSKD